MALTVLNKPQGQPTMTPGVQPRPTGPVPAPLAIAKPVPQAPLRVTTANGRPIGTPQQGTTVSAATSSKRTLPEDKKQELAQMIQRMEQSGVEPENISSVVRRYTDENSIEEVVDAPQPQGVKGVAGFGVGVAKGAGSTASSIGSMGQSILDQTVGRVMNVFSGKGFTKPKNDVNAEAAIKNAVTPKGTAEKIGFGVEQVGEFFVPATRAAKAASYLGKGVDALNLVSKATQGTKTVGAFTGAKTLNNTLKLGTRSIVGGAEAGLVTAAQTGDLDKAKNATMFGVAFPVATKALGVLGSGAKEVAKTLSSGLSGVPKAAMEQAFRNPQAVQSAISKAVQEGGDVAAQRIGDNALDALNYLKKARSEAYERNLANVEKNLMKTQNGQLYVKRMPTAAEATTPGYKGGEVWFPTDLSLKGLKDIATKTIKDFGGSARGKALDLGEMAIDKTHAKKINEVVGEVYNWKNITPMGLEKLKRKIASYRLGGVNLGSSEKQFNAIVARMEHNIADYVGERVPKIKEMRLDYAKQSEVIDNIIQQLKLGKGDPNTALRKLVNVFSPKSEVYRPIVEELGEKAGIDLMSDIAGLTMSKWGAEGLSKYLSGSLMGGSAVGAFINPAALAAAPALLAGSSPRIVGGAITTLGKINNSSKGQALKKTIPRTVFGSGSVISR